MLVHEVCMCTYRTMTGSAVVSPAKARMAIIAPITKTLKLNCIYGLAKPKGTFNHGFKF